MGLMNPFTVLVVDDHPVVRPGLRALLSNDSDIQVAAEAEAEAADGPSAPAVVRRCHPDVVVLDIRLVGLDGIAMADRLREYEPSPRVMIPTSYDDNSYLTPAFEAGVHAFLLKSASDETLGDAVRSGHRGERRLSPPLLDRVLRQFAELRRAQPLAQAGRAAEEYQLVSLPASGASNAVIAATCHWSPTSVKRRLQTGFAKLQVQTRAEAAAEAVRRGLA
jgi:DNA-binding NarL/FixJ family response regulator